MKSLIIYMSIHHNNTENVAKAITQVLEAELIKAHKVDINKVDNYDLIGFGSGIYWGKHHQALLKLSEKLPDLKGKRSFIFSTSGLSNWMNSIHHIRNRTMHFHNPLKKKLSKKGFDIINEFTCRGFDTVGPLKLIGGICKCRPNEKDLENAKKFARKLKEV
ncbi:MAG: flavodoxin family protein [Euryarchaeota archaeon]|nr:flavodoxin family protein [Euryarchaeota archaeon]